LVRASLSQSQARELARRSAPRSSRASISTSASVVEAFGAWATSSFAAPSATSGGGFGHAPMAGKGHPALRGARPCHRTRAPAPSPRLRRARPRLRAAPPAPLPQRRAGPSAAVEHDELVAGGVVAVLEHAREQRLERRCPLATLPGLGDRADPRSELLLGDRH